MIIDDNVRSLVTDIENASAPDLRNQILKLINTLHTNCQKSLVKQRYHDYTTKKFTLGTYPLDDDGYALAFDPLTQESEIWSNWYKFGVVVSKQVISSELAQAAIVRMGEIVKQLSNGKFDIDLPSTYEYMPKDQENVPFMSRGFVEIYHDDILAQLRQSLRVYLHYVIIWGRVDLWTTFDRMGVKLPEHPESAALPLHVDQNPLVDAHHHTRVQGVLALVDCKERGTLVVVPGSQALFPKYGQIVATNNSGYRGAYVELDLTQTFASTLAEKAQALPIRSGSLVTWSSGNTHANTKNIATDARKVAYIAMCPANEFDQDSLNARDSAFSSGVSKYDHKAGLHVTKKPRYIMQNTFRKPERLTFLGELLYSRSSYFSALRAKSNKKLLLNAESFGFGPSAAIADLMPKLKQHFAFVGFIGCKFSFELQPSGYDAVHIIDNLNNDRDYIRQVMTHYDLLLTCSDFKMAELAQQNNLPVAVYDMLAWFWPTIPAVLAKPDVLYLAQNFYTVRDRLEQNKHDFNVANIVPPIFEPRISAHVQERNNILLNFGGLKNPYWSDANVLEFATLIHSAVQSVIPPNSKLIVAANNQVAAKLNGKNYSRDEMLDLLSTVRLAIVTPGLGNIFESAAYDIPTIFLPPANDSQARQAQLVSADNCADYSIDWQDLGIAIDYTTPQNEIMRSIAAAIQLCLEKTELRAALKDQIVRAYQAVIPLSTSKLSTLRNKFGTNGSEQVIQVVKSFAEAHRPWLAEKASRTLFSLPEGQQLNFRSDSVQITKENIKQLQAHIPGLSLSSNLVARNAINLHHVQTNESQEFILPSGIRELRLEANYTAKMPQDILHLMYGFVRRNWLEQKLAPVHGACLELPDGRFILIVGNSGTGKSSSALKLVLQGHAKLFSGDKTLIKFVDKQMCAIAGTTIMTLRKQDRSNWPQITDAQGEYYGDRFVFDLLPEQYSKASIAPISAIFLLQPHAPLSLLQSSSALHTLFPYFLDLARANVIVGDALFDGRITYKAMDDIRRSLTASLQEMQVYQLSVSAGDVVELVQDTLNLQPALRALSSAVDVGVSPKKFLFGVCGLGSGHTYRQMPIMDALLADGHQIAIFAYGMALEKFRGYYAHEPAVKIFEVANEYLIGNKDGLDYAASFNTPLNQQDFAHINLRALSEYNDVPDCVISDYEKISAHVAYRHNVPLITLDQQSKFLLTGFPPDEIQRLRTFFPTAARRIALSFFNVPATAAAETEVTMMAPVLRNEILALKGCTEFATKTILVYSSSMYPLNIDRLKTIAENFADVRFVFFPHVSEDYLKILGGCHGIIATAGHSLLSEAMYLQKPVLAVPAPIYEQQLNASIVSGNNFGMQCLDEELSTEKVQSFVQRLDEFKQNIQADPNHVLMGGIDTKPLVELLYSAISNVKNHVSNKKLKLQFG